MAYMCTILLSFVQSYKHSSDHVFTSDKKNGLLIILFALEPLWVEGCQGNCMVAW